MHLGPEQTAAFVRQVLAEGTYVVCHQTLTYGDHPAASTGDSDTWLDMGRRALACLGYGPVLDLPASRHDMALREGPMSSQVSAVAMTT